MSPQLLRILFGILLLGHGVGHALTAFPLLGIRLSGTHSTGSRLLGSVLWLRWPGGVFDG